MEKFNIEKMEIGNLIYGNSRGNYHIDRETYSSVFFNFLEQAGFDSYGHRVDMQDNCFENDIFILRPYYWGDDETFSELPNFVYKPENIEISWYKYPLRDAYCSHDISLEKFEVILNACLDSML